MALPLVKTKLFNIGTLIVLLGGCMPSRDARSLPDTRLLGRVTHTTPDLLYLFPDNPHIKFKPKHKLAAYERNVDWFRFWLLGYEDPNAAKAPQYARWNLMKRGA